MKQALPQNQELNDAKTRGPQSQFIWVQYDKIFISAED